MIIELLVEIRQLANLEIQERCFVLMMQTQNVDLGCLYLDLHHHEFDVLAALMKEVPAQLDLLVVLLNLLVVHESDLEAFNVF